MEDELLQLGIGSRPHPLAKSSSYVQRGRPSLTTRIGNSGQTPYVTSLVFLGADQLVSHADDGMYRFLDKNSLQVVREKAWGDPGQSTCVKAMGDDVRFSFVSASRNGQIGCWDARQASLSMTIEGPSRAPYLSAAVSGNIIAAGTELHGVDATIDLWDARNVSAPMFTYEEAHSDDVTGLSFHPETPFALLSASSDSLIAISDVRQANEDDSVLGVINTGASVARAGWGGSARRFPKVDPVDGAAQSLDIPPLGAFWSVSDMQTVGVWEADSFNELLSPCDVRRTKPKGALAMDSEPFWETEYVIDASSDASLLEDSEGVGIFCGEQGGGMALVEIPNAQSSRKDWALHCRTAGGHSEIVRSVAWDASTYTLFSGGEDGRICAWGLSGDRSDGVPLNSMYTTQNTHSDKQTFGQGANALPLADRYVDRAPPIASGSGRKSAKERSYKPY